MSVQLLSRRELEAIEKYKEWLNKHPKAARKLKVNKFDEFLDSAALAEAVGLEEE